MQLQERVAAITGGTAGIGLGIARAFLTEGASVALMARNEEKGQRVIEALDAGDRAVFIRGDAMIQRDVEGFVDSVVEQCGSVDILVNNAGGAGDLQPMTQLTDEAFDEAMKWNVYSTFWASRRALTPMLERGWGRIINISSVVGVIGNPGQASYVASKAGIIGLTKSVAKELAPRSITVNAVAPGYVDTDMTAALPEKAKTAMLDQIPLRRAGTPEDVAAVVEFLVSDRASYITGQVIHVSGGMFI